MVQPSGLGHSLKYMSVLGPLKDCFWELAESAEPVEPVVRLRQGDWIGDTMCPSSLAFPDLLLPGAETYVTDDQLEPKVDSWCMNGIHSNIS